MNRTLLAATIYNIQTPTTSDIRDMIVNYIFCRTFGKEEHAPSSQEEVLNTVKHLCCAYISMLKSKPVAKMVVGEEAEKVFSQGSLEGMRCVFPDTKEDDDSVPCFCDSMLPFDFPLPASLVSYVGNVLGYKHAVDTKNWYEYCQHHDRINSSSI